MLRLEVELEFYRDERIVPSAAAKKFVYRSIGDGVSHRQAQRALGLLIMARLCHPSYHPWIDTL